jgi:mannan endo-1,4-beta-mannosidase
MGASEGTVFDNTVQPAFQPQLGEYDENVLIGLDYLLSEMAKRDMKAVIYLGNFWIWTGGFAQYVGWVTGEKVPNPFLQEYNWDQFINFSSSFYSNKEAVEAYNNYVTMLVNRENTITGIKYKDDPTIMSWQLANEPRPGRGEIGRKNFNAFSQWIANTARLIKSLDSQHLVSTGNEGLVGSMFSEELYLSIHDSENIDYMTAHLWILNWAWYDPENPEKTFPEARQKALDYLDQHIAYAHQLHKPQVMEEFGIPRDNHSYSPFSSVTHRDKFYQTVFDKIYSDAISRGPMAGSNFWTWAGMARPAGKDSTKWEVGDPFIGDPPQEPQGRNSVFSSDISTLELLKSYARKMNNIQ